MPLYEFRCEKCCNVVELLMKYSELGPESCEACGEKPMLKICSLSSYVLKGKGRTSANLKNRKAPNQKQYLKVTDGNDIPPMPKGA